MLRTSWLKQFAVTLRRGSGRGRRQRRRIPTHPAQVERLEDRTLLSGEEPEAPDDDAESDAESLPSYDYATFAEETFDHVALPTLGEVIAYDEGSGEIDNLLAGAGTGSTAVIDQTITDGDTTTTVTTGSDDETTTVVNTWTSELVMLGSGTTYTEILTETYTITTTWNDGQGEDYVLTQWGTSVVGLTLNYSGGQPTDVAKWEQQEDFYTHTRHFDTSETGEDGDVIDVDGVYVSNGEQRKRTYASKSSLGLDDNYGAWVSMTVLEGYNSDITTTVTTDGGSTVSVQAISAGQSAWTQSEERVLVTPAAVAGGDYDVSDLWIWPEGDAPEPLAPDPQSPVWSDWQLPGSPTPSFLVIGTTFSQAADEYDLHFYAGGWDDTAVLTLTAIDESETETVDESVTDPQTGQQTTIATDVTIHTFADGESTLTSQDAFSFEMEYVRGQIAPDGTVSYDYADRGGMTTLVDELTVVTVTAINSQGTSTLVATDDVLTESEADYESDSYGNLNFGFYRYDEEGEGTYALLTETSLTATDTSEPDVLVELDTLDRLELSGGDGYVTFLESTQTLSVDAATGLGLLTDTYVSSDSASGTDREISTSTSELVVTDTSEPAMTIVVTTLLETTDEGITVWDSTSDGDGFVVETLEPPLTSILVVLRAEDHTTYEENSHSIDEYGDPGPRTSTLLTSVTVDIDHNDDGIIKTVDSHDDYAETTTYLWASHAEGYSDFVSSERRFDADDNGTLDENERQTDVSLSTHDFSEYHETGGHTDFLTDIGSTETAAGTTPEGLTQTLLSTSSYVDDGSFDFTLDTTSTVDFSLTDTDLSGGSLPEPDPELETEDADEIVTLTIAATLVSTTSSGHSDVTASEFVDFDELDETEPGVRNETTVDRTYNAEGTRDFSSFLNTTDTFNADESTESTIISASSDVTHMDYSSVDETTWDLRDETAAPTIVTSVGSVVSTVTNGVTDSNYADAINLTTIGTPIANPTQSDVEQQPWYDPEAGWTYDAGEDGWFDSDGNSAPTSYDSLTTGTSGFILTASDSHDFTIVQTNEDETATIIDDGASPPDVLFSQINRVTYNYEAAGSVGNTLDAGEDFTFHSDGTVTGQVTSETLEATATADYTLSTDTYDAMLNSTPVGSSSHSSDVTYTETGDSFVSRLVDAVSDLNADGSVTGTVVTENVDQIHSSHTLSGTIIDNPGFTTTLDGQGHSDFDSLFRETNEFVQPPEGEGDLEETIATHSEYTLDEGDNLTLDVDGAITAGWVTTTIDGTFGYGRDRDVDAVADKTVGPDGTVLAQSDRTETHTVQSSHGDFEITAGGAYSDANISVSFSMTLEADFSDFSDESLLVEDGVTTEDLLLETNSVGSSYEHSLSASSPGFWETVEASGGNSAANEITRDLLTEHVEGSSSTWFSNTTTSSSFGGGGVAIERSGSETTVYEYVRSLGAPSGWIPLEYSHRSVAEEWYRFPNGATGMGDYNWDVTYTDGSGYTPVLHPLLDLDAYLSIASPTLYPTEGAFAPAHQATLPQASPNPYVSSGATAEGGTWELDDDGYYWRYQEWDSGGTLVKDEHGYHHIEGPWAYATGTATAAQPATAPLDLGSGPAPEVVWQALEEGGGDNPFRRLDQWSIAGAYRDLVYRPDLNSGLGSPWAYAAAPIPDSVREAADDLGVPTAGSPGPIIIADENGRVVYADPKVERGVGGRLRDIFRNPLDSEAEAYERRGYHVIRIPGASQMSDAELQAQADALRNGNRRGNPTPTPPQVAPKPPPVPGDTTPPPTPAPDPAPPPVTEGFWDDKPAWLVALAAGQSGDLLDRLMTEDPDFWESVIPIWGPMRGALANFNRGDYFWGTVDVGFAVLDATGGGWGLRALWKLGPREAGATALKRLKRFFRDDRPFTEISRAYWREYGPANGRALHHWWYPRAERVVNAGWNLLTTPGWPKIRNLNINTFMGWAPNWQGTSNRSARELARRLERGIRFAIPSIAATDVLLRLMTIYRHDEFHDANAE